MSFHNNFMYNFNNQYYQTHSFSYETNVESETVDIEFVKNWLSSRNTKQKTNDVTKEWRIPKLKKSLKSVLQGCESISNLETHLRNNVAMLNEVEWHEAMQLMQNWKDEISQEVICSDSAVVEDVGRKLKKRTKKRLWQKRKRAISKLKRQQEKQLSYVKKEKMEQELKQMQCELEKKRKEKQFKSMVDNVLKDVNKRKANAKRYLSLLDALLKLRTAREKSALGRGEKNNLQHKTEFIYNIEKLKELWSIALNEYSLEETKLREKLNESNTEHCDPTMVLASEKCVNEWKSTLFGSDMLPQKDFQHDVHTFITVRNDWDKFISNDSDATSLPSGWVVPPDNTKKQWRSYQIDVESTLETR